MPHAADTSARESAMLSGMDMPVKYLWKDRDRHGNVRLYVAVPGRRKIRIREEPGTEAFWAAYTTALKGEDPAGTDPAPKPARRQPAPPGSLRQLCQQYMASPEFKALAGSTKSVRRNLLDAICRSTIGDKTRGDLPHAPMEPRDVRRLRDEHADKPDGANGRVKALRQMFAWAVEAGAARHNPAIGVPYLKTSGDGFHTWTVAEVRQFQAAHPPGTKAHLALSLLLYTGVRRCDAVFLGRQMIRPDGSSQPWLHFTETKGRDQKRKDRAIPVLPQLQAAIDTGPAGHMTFLVTEFGKPFTAAGFGNRFRKWCDEAGLTHCSAHGLRKAGATIAAENGATEHQLMAIYGWDSPKQAALYTREANRRRLAGEAMHLVVPGEQSGDKILPLDKGVDSGGRIRGKKSG